MKDRVVSNGIVVNRDRMSGTPCIQGTRIPARMVAELLEDFDPGEIMDDYPSLTYMDMANAKGWAKKQR